MKRLAHAHTRTGGKDNKNHPYWTLPWQGLQKSLLDEDTISKLQLNVVTSQTTDKVMADKKKNMRDMYKTL